MFSTNASQVSTAANYIEDVFSTYLYTGNGSTQTITNGIDLAGKGGLWWGKQRDSTGRHWLVDTARGGDYTLCSNLPDAQTFAGFGSGFFTSNGVSFNATNSIYNGNGNTYASWTFRKQAKFFDVVTFTEPGGGSFSVNHSLGANPGCVIIKSTSTSENWFVYHNGVNGGVNPQNYWLNLNTIGVQNNNGVPWISFPNTTQFTIGGGFLASGQTYVAYLFAHNAGGFGLTGNDNVISCGSYTGTGGDLSVTLGYEPQWLLVKRTNTAANWQIVDVMRGIPVSGPCQRLEPSTAIQEATAGSGFCFPTATGFGASVASSVLNNNGDAYIYIAIRRGPMKVPTSGASVFTPVTFIGGTTNKAPVLSGLNAPDLALSFARSAPYGIGPQTRDRLSSNGRYYLETASTSAQTDYSANTDGFSFLQTGIDAANVGSTFNYSSPGVIYEFFKRAPGFFDEVCYTGTGSATTFSHNLGVVPELMIVKSRSDIRNWAVYTASGGSTKYLNLNLTNAFQTLSTFWNNTDPTSNVFTVGTSTTVNISGQTYVNYLFATCPGVSKVGSYTGTGATQTINCGFTGGARFVLIKRTDSTGDWYVWDTARGMVSGTDPSLLLNSTAAEVNANSVYTTGVGFQIVSTAAGINASGGSYIFLAIA
jgi:hypothetical protein